MRERYGKSISLMSEACGLAHRAYVFDNSGSKHKLLAEVVDDRDLKVKSGSLPMWFVETDLWRSFSL